MTRKVTDSGKWIAEVHADVGPNSIHIIERCGHDHPDAQRAADCAWRLALLYQTDNRPAVVWYPHDADVKRGMV